VPQSLSANKYDLIKAFKHLKVDYQFQEQGEWLVTKRDSNKVNLKRRSVPKNNVPNLVGLSAKDAVYLIESKGMSAHVSGYGKVVKQSIPAGRPVFHGGVIELMLD
jgi:cell division protein FtsI (penicillin-binding protein 3)